MAGKKCPNCGACKECGAPQPQIVPMPYPVYPYVQPWVTPYTQPWPNRWTVTYGTNVSMGNTNQSSINASAGGVYQ